MKGHDQTTHNKTPTDEELMHEAAAGNQEAGDTLSGRDAPPAFGVASETLDRGTAEDTVRGRHRLILIIVAGTLVTAALAVFGLEHTRDYSLGFFGSSGTGALRLKSEIATGLLGLGLFQLFLALWLFGRLPGMGTAARPIGRVHRAAGMVLFLVTLPVAVHCMFAYGVRMSSARATVHSLAGCFFYGAFVAKILVVRSRALPGWALPIAGGLLVLTIGVLWYTSAIWFFNGYHLPVG
jgi:hypothetical protein